jgi:hypothetical protein
MEAKQDPETAESREPMIDLAIYEPSQDLSAHPAARAWSKLQGRAAKPCGIDVLRPPRQEGYKSCTFRVCGLDRKGPSIVAKLCQKEIAAVERLIYETILPELPLPKLGYYGTIASDDPEMDWVFIEDAGEVRYLRELEGHRHVAAEWIATLHMSAQNLPGLKQLPDRGPAHYLNHLRSGRERIKASHSNPVLTRDQRAVLDRVESHLQRFEASWNELERSCEVMPSTLVHGDLAGRNARLRGNGNRRRLVVFDWETAGRGVPAIDLASSRIYASSCCLKEYFSRVRSTWPNLTMDDTIQMATVGRIFRVIAAIDWAALNLAFQVADWLIMPISEMESYLGRIDHVLRDSVWAHSWGGQAGTPH